jgi:tetratricopeptide (TPR) repeat protein
MSYKASIANAIWLHHQALAAMDEGRLWVAEAAAVSSLEIFEEEDGPDSLDAANVATTLGAIAEARGDLAAAFEHARHAWRVMEALEEPCVGDKADAIRVEALGRAGAALREMARYDEAEPWLRRAVALAEKVGDGSLLAGALNDLGMWFRYTGNLDEAERLYGRALSFADRATKERRTR